MQAPLRLHLCLKFMDGQARTSARLFAELAPDYVNEIHFTPQRLESHLQALKAVSILKTSSSGSTPEETLYTLTEYGRNKVRKAAL